MEEKTIDKIDLDEDSEEEETIQLWMPRGIIHNSTLCGGAQKNCYHLRFLQLANQCRSKYEKSLLYLANITRILMAKYANNL